MFNQDSNSVFRLSKEKNDILGRCLEEPIKTLPSTFTGRPIDVIRRPKHARAVDWVDIVIFIIPTIVTELLKQSRCERNAVSCLVGLVEARSIALSWKVTNEDTEKAQILLDQWHILAMEKLEYNFYTSVMHYLRHIPQALKYLGPTRAYSTRPPERIIGVYSRLIKIASCIMDDTIAEENRRKKVYALSTNEAAPELWEVLENHMDLSQIEEKFGTSDLDGLLLLAKNFYSTYGCIYDSKFYLDKRSKRPTTLVKLTLPVNVYARSTQSRSELVWGEFFGTEKILALVQVFILIKLIVHGMPCGPPPDYPRHSKIYVCEAENVDCLVGTLNTESCTK
ncbi:hypothetical protein BDA99DRAFT_542376 [Phascolomyces articulosus]|uniref:Uncharacterized protein n=1 Tax=Phascolomyces articulosus TaxID=60185 RepID=A0AAD5JQ88_9FUNG|nr:hypothetical protein BDA99DRAFT_542376 [Phascolomyces articulosus]